MSFLKPIIQTKSCRSHGLPTARGSGATRSPVALMMLFRETLETPRRLIVVDSSSDEVLIGEFLPAVNT